MGNHTDNEPPPRNTTEDSDGRRLPWGPFVNKDDWLLPLSQTDFRAVIAAFILCVVFACLAAYVGVQQTKKCRQPWKSAYISMIWLEWTTSLVMSILCLMFILNGLSPSLYFFMSISLLWVIQTQCLLQIVIDRIRILRPNNQKGKHLTIGTIIITALLNTVVCASWVLTLLQIRNKYARLSTLLSYFAEIIYMGVNNYLNIYFMRTIKEKLVGNGLQKYERLVHFSQGMIFASILMDVMILLVVDHPNFFVFMMFSAHAYLVKLNIEMSMANLITKIATNSNNPANGTGFRQISTSPIESRSHANYRHMSILTWYWVSIRKFFARKEPISLDDLGGIEMTQEVTVINTPKPWMAIPQQSYQM